MGLGFLHDEDFMIVVWVANIEGFISTACLKKIWVRRYLRLSKIANFDDNDSVSIGTVTVGQGKLCIQGFEVLHTLINCIIVLFLSGHQAAERAQ
jgi:hypothetical protein